MLMVMNQNVDAFTCAQRSSDADTPALMHRTAKSRALNLPRRPSTSQQVPFRVNTSCRRN